MNYPCLDSRNLGVGGMKHIILIMVMASQVHTYAKIIKLHT